MLNSNIIKYFPDEISQIINEYFTQDEEEKNNPFSKADYEILEEYYETLKQATDANGNPFTIIRMPYPDLSVHAIPYVMDNKMFDGLFNSALECHKAGNFHGAISEYKAIHEKWPNHFDTVQLLGVALAQIGDFSSALQYFDEALLINAESYAVFNNKGNALKAIGKTDAAINCYQSAIALNSNYYEARFNLATLFLEIKNYGEARDQLLKCIELRKNSSRSFYALGVAYSGLKQNENAIKLFGQCLETDNRYTDAYVARGLELIKSKKH